MPGAFAHITLVNEASSTNNLDSIELNDKAYDSLLSWLEYIELGAVSLIILIWHLLKNIRIGLILFILNIKQKR